MWLSLLALRGGAAGSRQDADAMFQVWQATGVQRDMNDNPWRSPDVVLPDPGRDVELYIPACLEKPEQIRIVDSSDPSITSYFGRFWRYLDVPVEPDPAGKALRRYLSRRYLGDLEDVPAFCSGFMAGWEECKKL